MSPKALLLVIAGGASLLSCAEGTEPQSDKGQQGNVEQAKHIHNEIVAVVSRLGGQVFPEEPPGSYFVKLTDSQCESHQLGQLSRFPGIVELSLLNTRTDDDALASIVKLSNLRTLTLESTKITDTGMVSIAKLENLRTLDLSKTRVTHKGLSALRDMGRLLEIDLSFTRIHGREFEPLLTLSGLRRLILDNSQTTLLALQVFERIKTLEDIYMEPETGGFYNVWGRGGGPLKGFWRQD